MGLIVSNTDFTGKYGIATDVYTKGHLDDYISRFEVGYLVELLGVDLYDLFKLELDTNNPPTTPIYKAIYDPLDVVICGKKIRTEGMKSMLLGFIYFEFMRDYAIKSTVTGTVVGQSENARESGPSEFNLWNRYNLSIHNYRAIQTYIKENEVDYPTFDGQCKSVAHWSI